MTHLMNLNPAPFLSVASGQKKVELRLFDQKRSAIKKGDKIIFTNTQTKQEITVLVEDIKRFDDFHQLYQAYSPVDMGYEVGEKADADDMLAYYLKEDIEKYGACAIEIGLIKQ